MHNVLGPLVIINQPKKNSQNVKCGPEKLISISEEYSPQHVCELCHRVYKIYANKKETQLSCNSNLSASLFSLAQKQVEKWTTDDIKFLLEVYGRTLPAIKSSSTQHTRRPPKIKSRDYFFGYQAVIETPVALPILDKEEGTSTPTEKPSRDYIKQNIRKLSQPPQKKISNF